MIDNNRSEITWNQPLEERPLVDVEEDWEEDEKNSEHIIRDNLELMHLRIYALVAVEAD